MEIICNAFINKVETTTRLGIGSSFVILLGHHQHKQIAKSPHSKILTGSGHPDDQNKRVIKYSPTHKELVELIESNEDLLLELFLTELIQHWFDYLADLYQEIVKSCLRGEKKYKLSKVQPKIDFSELSNSNLEQILIHSSVQSFNFQSAQKKIDIIEKALSVDLSHLSNEKNNIKKFIVVRNIFQHSLGYVRCDDLDMLGKSSIHLDDGQSQKCFNAGDRLKLSAFDMETCADSLIAIAKALAI